MNRIERVVRTVDAWQQRHTVAGFVFGVIKKFGDDEASYLVALLTYFAFLATFPLLLTLVAITLFWAAFRLGTAATVRSRDLLVAAVLSGVAWQILLTLAGLVVKHYLRHAQSVAGTFGIVLGLLAWFALQATVTVYAIEADVVRIRRLWLRSIAAPPLTEPDMRALSAAAELETRRPEQHVWTRFTRRGDTKSS